MYTTEYIRTLQAASGWLDLGNYQAAYDELETLSPEARAYPESLKLYCRVWQMAGKWKELAVIAEGAGATYAHEPEFFWQYAWALHKQGQSEGAAVTLFSYSDQFLDDSEYAYRLACVLAVLDQLPAARDWLHKAIEYSKDPKTLKLRALDQPELDRLWKEVQSDVSDE